MDEQTIQEAAASFCKVPEIYQQIFKQAGADFPDELVKQIKQKPEQDIQMLQNNQDLLKNIVTIYSQYKDQIQGAMKQSKMFKEGGQSIKIKSYTSRIFSIFSSSSASLLSIPMSSTSAPAKSMLDGMISTLYSGMEIKLSSTVVSPNTIS